MKYWDDALKGRARCSNEMMVYMGEDCVNNVSIDTNYVHWVDLQSQAVRNQRRTLTNGQVHHGNKIGSEIKMQTQNEEK